jgi:hypothetical protein
MVEFQPSLPGLVVDFIAHPALECAAHVRVSRILYAGLFSAAPAALDRI